MDKGIRILFKIRKKAWLLVFACLTLLSAAASAGCGKPAQQDENTLSFLIRKSDLEKKYIQRIIERYEKQSDIKIKAVAIEDANFETEAAAMFKRGEIPDMFWHFNNSLMDNFNVSENFYYLNDEEWIDELTDGAKAYCLDSAGNVIGLPFWESSVSGCYYNKKLLDEMGLKAATTQAEFDALCDALKSIGYTPMYWAANGCNWIFQFGLDPVFADDPQLLEKLNKNEITYAEIPAVRNMVEWLEKAAKKGWFNDDYASASWDDIAPAIENGDAVCAFLWDTWFSTDFKEGGKYAAEDFALMPVFMNTADDGTYEGGNMNMLMVNKNSKKREQALEFLRFCAAPENYNAAFDGVYTVSNFKRQTTNIQSDMVTNAFVSIQANQRVSTAWPKIAGYNPDDVGAAVLKLFQGEVDVDGCIKLMDDSRIAAAKE